MDTIPLHLLPNEAYTLVLLSMEIYDQLAYSLCTKNTKKAVKSLNLTAEEINFYISDDIEFEFRFKNSIAFLSYMLHGNDFPNKEFRVPDIIEVTVYRRLDKETEWEWNFQNIGVKDWLWHFCEVLHHPRIDELLFNGEHITDDFIEPVQKAIEGLQLVDFGLGEDLTPEFTKKALESFHNYEKLYIERVPFDSPEVYKIDKFLVQNLSNLCIPGAERLKIEQVLLANCEKLKLPSSMATDKDLKIFVKLWICGSNPRLKYFFTRREDLPEQQNRPFDEEVFFKGIKRSKIPLDSQEVYIEQVNENYNEETKLAGGHRIWRFDGTEAVVLIRGRSFNLIVDV